MMTSNINAATATDHAAESKKGSRTTPDIRSARSTHDPELWKWTKTEYEARTEHDADGIGEPQNAHRDGSIARATKDGVDHEEHHDCYVAGEHDCSESPAFRHYLRRSAHY